MLRYCSIPAAALGQRRYSTGPDSLSAAALPPIQAFIFDSDGTLVDSEVPSMDVIYEQALSQGVRFTREEAHRVFRGLRMAEVIAWVSARMPQVPDDFAEVFARTVRSAQAERFHRGLGTIRGARELLGQLTVPFCVATNGPREKVELTLGLTGLLPCFGDRIFSAYEVGSFKPDPGLFLHAARVLGVAPQHCAVVEDSEPGIRAGLAAGMRVFSLFPADQLAPELQAQVVSIRDLTEIPWRGPGT